MTSDAIDTAVRQAREVMDGFMVAFNAEDDAIRKRWFNFPHVRFHGGRVTIMERPEDFHSTVWERLGAPTTQLDSTATKLGRLAGRAFAELKKRAKEPSAKP